MTVYTSQNQPPPDPMPTGVLSVRHPVGRWSRRVMTVLVLLVVGALLFVEAYVSATFAPDNSASRNGANSAVPAAVASGSPVIDATGAHPRTFAPPPHTIALTFDDGPDPVWTPRILDMLERFHIPATFFTVGAQVARHPDIARRIVEDGNEIGVHTFSHPELDAIPQWRRTAEYGQAQLAIAGATGVKTSLLRPPYSSSNNAVTDADWQVMRQIGADGYLIVLENLDSDDWARPGVPAILSKAEPDGDAGAVVLMHDAGGDRSQTVSALEQYIPAMQQRGYRFTTVSEAVSSQVSSPGNVAAGSADRWRGRALLWTVAAADGLTRLMWWILVIVGALTLVRTLLLFGVAVRQARRRRAPTWSWGPPVTEPVSVIVPAFNEETTIAATVRSLAASTHPDVEVIVVDDESTDGTAAAVEALGLTNVRLVRKPSGGKASALNTGVALARHDLIVMVDADTVLAPNAIHELVQPFGSPTIGAVAGNVKVGNRGRLIARWQHIEYVIGFSLDRRLYDALGCIPTIPGALGAFRRQALIEVGGLNVDTLAEDTDLTMAILRHGRRVVYQETAVARTEAPDTLRQLTQQRYRWSYGTIQALWKHRRAMVERGPSGRFGRRGLPLIGLFTVILPMFAPVMDVLTVFGVVFLNRWVTLAAWVGVLVLQTITAILAFRLDREPLRPLWALPLQQFFYRQIMYGVLVRSAATAVAGRELGWRKLHRRGVLASETPNP